jgi:hypothetical protein
VAQWIDLALIDDEQALSTAIRDMDDSDRAAAIGAVVGELGLTKAEVERAILRVMIERARPLALPTSLWSRSITASDDPKAHVRAHFTRRGIAETPERLQQAVRLYFRFAEDRKKIRIRESDLKRCGYRCEHCGLAFCNEDLDSRALISPFGLRGTPKIDALKPHWNGGDELRYPTVDHHWPVSLYGDNSAANLRVLCGGCNQGKANYMALEQLPSSVGLVGRNQLLGSRSLSFEAFYTQIRRSPLCERTGQSPAVTELTVQLRDPRAPSVLDNLITVASPGN